MNKKFFNLLLYIEKRQGILFNLIMFLNELYIKFYLSFSKPKIALCDYCSFFSANGLEFAIRALDMNDLNKLRDFFKSSIDINSPDFFMPHKTDSKTLVSLFRRISHILLGVFHKDVFIGYALIRLLFPNKASYALFISDEWQGKGIGTAALEKELDLIREMGFRAITAVYKKNLKSLSMLKKLNIEFSNDLGEYFEIRDTH